MGDERGFLGKNFYRVVVQDMDEGYWEVWFREAGYSPYRGYYPNGAMREEGECLVEFFGFSDNEPVPDRHAVRWGKYYLPDGRLGSEVKNGSGTQTYWYSDGTKCWELELRDFKRRRLMWWKPDGTLFTREEYDRDGRRLPPPPPTADGEQIGGWFVDGRLVMIADADHLQSPTPILPLTGPPSAGPSPSPLPAAIDRWYATTGSLSGARRVDKAEAVIFHYSWLCELLPFLAHEPIYNQLNFQQRAGTRGRSFSRDPIARPQPC